MYGVGRLTTLTALGNKKNANSYAKFYFKVFFDGPAADSETLLAVLDSSLERLGKSLPPCYFLHPPPAPSGRSPGREWGWAANSSPVWGFSSSRYLKYLFIYMRLLVYEDSPHHDIWNISLYIYETPHHDIRGSSSQYSICLLEAWDSFSIFKHHCVY